LLTQRLSDQQYIAIPVHRQTTFNTMIASLAAFTNDAAGLEKCLRLSQSICTIALGALQPAHAQVEAWKRARGHFALGEFDLVSLGLMTALLLACTHSISVRVRPQEWSAILTTLLSIGRRYFRLLKWYPCSTRARQCLEASPASASVSSPKTSSSTSVTTLLETSKWAFLALYFFLEMWTIVRASSFRSTY
jgi:hypothetical protein